MTVMITKKWIQFCMGVTLVCFAGCIPYHKVVKSEFPQAADKKDQRVCVNNYLRTVPVYDQFKTLAIFDALWLSDEMRTAFVDLYGMRRGKDQAGREALLKRQLEENQHWVSFYLLADVRNKTHLSLHDKNAYWTVVLVTEKGVRIEPISVNEVELEPEYESLFAHRLNAFKTPYLVKFPASDLNGERYFTKGQRITLVISSPEKEVVMTWDKCDYKKQHELLKDEDLYWS